jgi:hypothetical protein
MEVCQVCGHTGFIHENDFEIMNECSSCFVQIPKLMPVSGVMTNDRQLSAPNRISFLNREQIHLVRSQHPNQLIDFGCGNGQFLFSILKDSKMAEVSYGIELDRASIEMCKHVGLDVKERLQGVMSGAVVTFWHSLEHLELQQMQSLLSELGKIEKLKLIIAVPNGQSAAWKNYSNRFAFFDPEAHFVQFSNRSLEILLAKYGFNVKSKHGFFSYGVFNAIQTVMNLSSERNKFYSVLKRGQGTLTFRDWFFASLGLVCNFPQLLKLLIAEFSSEKRGVLIVVAESRTVRI